MNIRHIGFALALLASPLAAQQTVTQVRSSPTTFTVGKTAPLQSDTNGSLRVTGTTTIDQTTPGTTNAVSIKQIGSSTASTGNGTAGTGTLRVTVASDNTAFTVNSTATGPVASAATASGNPVPIGCDYNTTAPTVTNGQRVQAQCSNRGSLNVEIMSGTSFIATSNGLTVQPYGYSSTFWSYTSGTSPILSNTTTAVTIKTAAGAGVINYIDSCQIGSTALGASVPFALRDGAGGTVKWAVRPPTAGWLTPYSVNFQPPLKGTANTLWEVVTTTADTSGTFDVNCQGHTGS